MHSSVPTLASAPRFSALHSFHRTLTGRIVCGLAATLVVALAAHVSFPLWFTPVPLTLQPLAVLGVGLALGPVDGPAAMLAYLLEGAAGLPVFSPAGPGGLLQLVGPTGGFLMAYPLVAFVAGLLSRRLRGATPAFVAALLACTAATVVLFAAGATWFHHITSLSVAATLRSTVYPFLPGEAVKLLAAAGTYSALIRRSSY